MWTEQTASGKTRFVERYENPYGGKPIKVSQTVDRVTKAIEKEMPFILQVKFEEKIKEFEPKTNKDFTFKSISQQWLDTIKPNVKASSYRSHSISVKFLNNKFGDKLLEDITHDEINKLMLTSLQSKAIGYRYAIKLINIFSRVIKYAYRYEGINKMEILNAIEIPKINMPDSIDLKYLTDEELQQVINYFEEKHLFEDARMITLQVSTGMRFNEMVSIRESDIDFNNNSINVCRNFDHINKLFTSPKTGQSRTIYFNQSLAPILKEQITIAKKKYIKFGLNRDEILLFVKNNGEPLNMTNFNLKLKKVGLPDNKATTHVFRHTFITKAVESGISKDIIAKQVGHVDTKMIDQVYAHFTEKMAEKQKEAILDFKII